MCIYLFIYYIESEYGRPISEQTEVMHYAILYCCGKTPVKES